MRSNTFSSWSSSGSPLSCSTAQNTSAFDNWAGKTQLWHHVVQHLFQLHLCTACIQLHECVSGDRPAACSLQHLHTHLLAHLHTRNCMRWGVHNLRTHSLSWLTWRPSPGQTCWVMLSLTARTSPLSRSHPRCTTHPCKHNIICADAMTCNSTDHPATCCATRHWPHSAVQAAI
jgi:hypothetical protein